MSIIKQIKTEIERLKSNMDDRDPLAPNQKAGYLFALADVLSFLSTLESEKPVPNDLEEAAEQHLDTMFGRGKHQPFYKDLFIAGAKWQKERDEMSKVNYEGARAVYDNTVQHLQEKIDEKYELGKMDMKEQMMEEAVEGWVAVDSDTDGKRRVTFFPQKPVRDVLTEYKYWAATRPMYESIKLDSNAFPSLKWEDEPKKVKLIIVKED